MQVLMVDFLLITFWLSIYFFYHWIWYDTVFFLFYFIFFLVNIWYDALCWIKDWTNNFLIKIWLFKLQHFTNIDTSTHEHYTQHLSHTWRLLTEYNCTHWHLTPRHLATNTMTQQVLTFFSSIHALHSIHIIPQFPLHNSTASACLGYTKQYLSL